MDKPAQILMQYERNDGFWSELVADVDDKDKQVTEGDQYVIAAIAVKSYSSARK